MFCCFFLKRVYRGTSEMGSIKFYVWWVLLVLTLFYPFVASHASSKLEARANIKAISAKINNADLRCIHQNTWHSIVFHHTLAR